VCGGGGYQVAGSGGFRFKTAITIIVDPVRICGSRGEDKCIFGGGGLIHVGHQWCSGAGQGV
jgi:hypothetical protein